MCNNKQPWLLLIIACYLLCPLCTHSTPLVRQTGRRRTQGHEGAPTTAEFRRQPCAHQSIGELIRTSPIILKALGAHIFTNDNDDDLNDMLQMQQQLLQDNFVATATTRAWQAAAVSTATTTASAKATNDNAKLKMLTAATTTTTTGTMTTTKEQQQAQQQQQRRAKMESILITLTPETIYKGASLLKMTPSAESAARNGGGGSSSSQNGSSSYAAESAYQYEGQLNATLQPLSCFDANLLKILPTELIAFGKLITVQQQQQQQQMDEQQQHTTTQQQADILQISINGLHRWSSQFENHIWKHLGWDDWSDFTLCSITCGKGVQQRFRRCLLDNPMVNLNMNLNLNAVDDDDDEDEDEEGLVDDDDEDHEYADNVVDDNDDEAAGAGAGVTTKYERQASALHGDKAPTSDDSAGSVKINVTSGSGNITHAPNDEVLRQQIQQRETSLAMYGANDVDASGGADVLRNQQQQQQEEEEKDQQLRVWSNANKAGATAVAAASSNTFKSDANTNGVMEAKTNHENIDDIKQQQLQRRRQRQRKRRKSTKNYSTMFCEGYNIEQRNCNTFECSDDINDLLKFYKKLPTLEEINIAATAAQVAAAASMPTAAMDYNATTVTMELAAANANAAGSGGGMALPSSTPANMGYIHSWCNALNFTLMLTVRLKNDSKTAATIFSIRNATHNLYLESCKDGLRLYLERDNSTEMLPVKFNLYDYRWHQVAISIQNGDFISIYVDCSWTNSFVVSKRLFSLPLEADVEIGRGFNGELQQLLVLPDNQERQQCSHKRTSINEVKRYIIDTFIDDYGN